MKYDTVIRFAKETDLLPWLRTQEHPPCITAPLIYSKPRKVNLLLFIRHDEQGKRIAKIKCPVNPLPIRGEFEIISTSEIEKLLIKLGWSYEEKINLSMFEYLGNH